jgi:type II secretory pathway pseudopilin PulG
MITRVNKGVSLVEVIVSATIITVFLSALVSLYNLQMNVIFRSARQVKATFLAEESIEAVKYMRDVSWNSYISPLSSNVDYYLVWQSGKWDTTTTNTYIDGLFERKMTLFPVSRDAQSNIVSSGGTLDPNTKKLTTTISWREGSATSTKVVSTYVSNLFDN